MTMNSGKSEADPKERFAFGKNWSRFLEHLDDERIEEAEKSLKFFLETDSLAGKTFLDMGSGSGLFSLCARRMGAKVCSVDYDSDSVECGRVLKERYFPGDANWDLMQGSVLDADFLSTLGRFDVVYSWGVLHHTGNLWQAMENVIANVADGGCLYISLYNDVGSQSTRDKWMKKTYVRAPFIGKILIASAFILKEISNNLFRDLVYFKNPIRRYSGYKKSRGMSVFHDWIDWVGGYPFEVSRPDDVFNFYRKRGFTLERMTTAGGAGTNQFLFKRQ